jgi:hypothetical protein
MRIFLSSPAGCDSGKRRQKAGKKKDREKRNMDLCMLLSGVHRPPPPTPHLSPTLRVLPHLPGAMVIRAGGTTGRPPLSPPVTHTPFQQLEATAVDLWNSL